MEDDDSKDKNISAFRHAMRDIRPLQQDVRAPHYKPKPVPHARFRRNDEQAVLKESLEADIDDIETGAGEALHFHRSSLGRRTMR
ncbi:MAG: hypothetical protein P8M18_00230 [Woeseiaceae bacterium]|nr:hypothetical protein [Woeseiaceae bacterium]